MTSVVQICNLALSHIGARAISALSESGAEAVQCNLLFGPARDDVLADFPWSFAATRVALAALPETPPSEWSYVYACPANCLSARAIHPLPADRHPNRFEIALGAGNARVVLCDVDEAVLLYTARITDPGLFSPKFVSALSYRLAAELAPPLTRKSGVQQAMLQLYAGALSEARRLSAAEGSGAPPPDPQWIAARS